MHRRRFLQKEAGEYMGFHESFISQLVNGDRTPGLENAIAIERMTGIPVEAWLPTASGKTVEPVEAAIGKRKTDKA